MNGRDLQYPATILAGGIVVGAVASALGKNPAWPIIIGMAALVLATLALHVHSVTAAAANEQAGKLAASQGRSSIVSASLVIGGIALLLGSCAPDLRMSRSEIVAVWMGWAALLMGIALTYAISSVGGRLSRNEVTILRTRRDNP